MRRKKLISPEKSLQDLVDYRFKLLFLPILSYSMAAAIFGGFVYGLIFFIKEPLNKAINLSIITMISLLMAEFLLGIFLAEFSSIKLTLLGKYHYDFSSKTICINLKEIVSVKPYRLFGIRCLSIRTVGGKKIQFSPCFYETAQMLDRVRELAGEEHILVRALEKELSRPRRELTKVWCWVIGSILVTMSIYLIGGNMYAAEHEKPLEQAIATYVRQHPTTAPNQSAIELQALMTKLGLSMEIFGDGSKVKVTPTLAASNEWKSIEISLNDFVNKRLDKTQDSSEPIPNKLATYLKNHQADLDAIATHLSNKLLPDWGNDSWIAQSDPKAENSPLLSKLPNFFSTTNLERLTIANLLDRQQQQQNVDFTKYLVILEKIQQSVGYQRSLIAQLHNLIGEGWISRLVRQIDSQEATLNKRLPQGWGNNLFAKERHKYMSLAIENELITANKFLQNPVLFDRLLVASESPLRSIPGLPYLISPRIRLAAVDRHREVFKGIIYWRKQNICRTDGNSGVTSRLEFSEHTIDPLMLTSQYPKVLKQDLLWELTTSVRQVKAKLAAGQNVDLVAKDFQLQSQVCPGERWTAKATDGAVNIAFSHPPDWKALGISNPNKRDSLTYTIKSIAKI